ASLTVLVLDRSTALTTDDLALLEATASRPRIVVANKCDLPAAWSAGDLAAPVIEASARTGAGIDLVRHALAGGVGGDAARDTPAVTNLRHAALLEQAGEALEHAREAAAAGTPEEFVLSDVHEARVRLEEVTG